MRKTLFVASVALLLSMTLRAQTALKKVYDEKANPIEQIDKALQKAEREDKFVICQVGGNWCPWCLRFADFMAKDAAISKIVNENFVFIHTNYNPRNNADNPQSQHIAVLTEAGVEVVPHQDAAEIEHSLRHTASRDACQSAKNEHIHYRCENGADEEPGQA